MGLWKYEILETRLICAAMTSSLWQRHSFVYIICISTSDASVKLCLLFSKHRAWVEKWYSHGTNSDHSRHEWRHEGTFIANVIFNQFLINNNIVYFYSKLLQVMSLMILSLRAGSQTSEYTLKSRTIFEGKKRTVPSYDRKSVLPLKLLRAVSKINVPGISQMV